MEPISKLSFLLGALILLIVITTYEPAAQRQTSASRTVNANQFPGADLGAKINAADKSLGTATGEIVVRGGGMISTQVIISSGHTLRVLAGTYSANTLTPPILMQSRTSLIGSGWDAIIEESTATGQFTVISAYNQARLNGSPDSNLLIRDIQVKGANKGFYSAPQAISLGNCSNCIVDHVWMNGTRSIGIQLGGSASLGYFADNSKVVNCLFTRVASQNLALVNGRNILFEGNRFMTTGQTGGPGSTNIDLEVNEAGDHLENVIIRNNHIDVRGSELPTTGNGIVVQATSGTPYVGHILVEKNTIIGGSNQGEITNVMSNGISVFGGTIRDVTVQNNVITRTGQAGIVLQGTRLIVMNNQMTDVGGGGTPGFIVQGVTNSRVIGNTLTYTGKGPVDPNMVVSADSRDNVIQGNTGFNVGRK